MDINIALVEPEIPQNTGNIARTCAAVGASLHLVKPLGFEIDDRKLKRAGLDYWDKLDITYYGSFDPAFFDYTFCDFYDGYHLRAENVGILVAEMEELR